MVGKRLTSILMVVPFLLFWFLPHSFFLFASLAVVWTASNEFGTYRLCEQRRFWRDCADLCEQRRFRRACASAQSRQNLRCSLIQAMSQEEPSDKKPDPWPLWMARYAQLQFVMTECSKTQIRLTGFVWKLLRLHRKNNQMCRFMTDMWFQTIQPFLIFLYYTMFSYWFWFFLAVRYPHLGKSGCCAGHLI